MKGIWGDAYANRSDRFLAGVAYLDGRPWLIRGGEVANTASSSLPYMDTVWPKLTRLNLNTVLVAVAWAWVEPEEGKYDFSPVAGTDVWVTFTPRTPGAPIAGLADAEAGEVKDGRWVPGRKMSGDDILVDYSLAKAAAANQSGSGLMFGPNGPTFQRVRLYRYR